jgi:hypothetical protein
MSTTTPTPTPAPQPQITSSTVNVWPYLPALLWGAILMGILTWWLNYTNLDLAGPIIIGTGLVAIVWLGMVAFMAVQRYRLRNKPEELQTLNAKAGPVLSIILFAAGGVLLLLAVWLCIQEKTFTTGRAFAEVGSLVAMGLIALWGGADLRVTRQSPLSRQHIFQWMLQKRKEVAIGLMVLGGLLLALGVYMVWSKGGLREFPGLEGVGVAAVGLALLGAGLFTYLNLERPGTIDAMRLLLLYCGSMTGLLFGLTMGVRILMWWNRYFLAGSTVWQSEEGWRFWFCIYVAFFSLALLFGSLMLGRADVRASATIRRTVFGYNTGLMAFLVAVILVVVNLFSAAVLPANVEWNYKGLQELDERTKQILLELKQPIKIYVLMQRYGPGYIEVNDMLDNFQNYASQMQVEYLSPDLDVARYRDLAQTYPELEKQTKLDARGSGGYGRGILIVYGEGPEGSKLPHTFIPDTDLVDSNRTTGAQQFKGEDAVISAIYQLANKGTRPKVYFTQLRGELFINDLVAPDARIINFRKLAMGLGEVADRLRKDGYDVFGLVWEAEPAKGAKLSEQFSNFTFAKKSDSAPFKIPDDCTILVIAGNEEPLPKDALKAIDDYMERGGKLVILTSAGVNVNGQFTDDGMADFCKKFNVELKSDFLMRWSDQSALDTILITVRVSLQSTSKAATPFVGKFFKMYMPRTVKPMTSPGNYQAQVMLEAAPENNGSYLWVETSASEIMQPITYERQLKASGKLDLLAAREPVPVAVSITDRANKPRGFVFGDYSFVSTSFLTKNPVQGGLSYDLFRSSLEVLAERQLPKLGISPREAGTYSLPKTDDLSMGRLLYLPLALMVLGLAGTGAGVWIVRRK